MVLAGSVINHENHSAQWVSLQSQSLEDSSKSSSHNSVTITSSSTKYLQFATNLSKSYWMWMVAFCTGFEHDSSPDSHFHLKSVPADCELCQTPPCCFVTLAAHYSVISLMGNFDALSKLTGFTLAVDIQPFCLCMLSHSTLSRFSSFLNLHLFGLSVLIDVYLPAPIFSTCTLVFMLY